jgi:hypothetical protein
MSYRFSCNFSRSATFLYLFLFGCSFHIGHQRGSACFASSAHIKVSVSPHFGSSSRHIHLGSRSQARLPYSLSITTTSFLRYIISHQPYQKKQSSCPHGSRLRTTHRSSTHPTSFKPAPAPALLQNTLSSGSIQSVPKTPKPSPNSEFSFHPSRP